MTDLLVVHKSTTELLDKLIAFRDTPVEVIFPSDMDPKEVVSWTKAIATSYETTDGDQAAKMHMLGRLHAIARMNPAVLKAAGCKDITAYEERVLGPEGRSTVWKYSSAYVTFPNITPAEVTQIGTENLVSATRVAKGKSDKQKAEIIKQAKKLPPKQFKGFLEGPSSLAGKGETTTASFNLFGSKAEIDELKEWFADPRFIAHAESNKPIKMVLAAIQSSSPDWPKAEESVSPRQIEAAQQETNLVEAEYIEPVREAREHEEDW